MNNVINLLEKMGQNVSLLDSNTLAQAISEADLTPELAAAIEAGDVQKLETLLGKNGDIFCSVKESDPEPKEQPAKEQPKKEEPNKKASA